MRILNQAKNTTLARKAIYARAYFSRLKGLLGRQNLQPDEALIIQPCNSVHTFFMRFPIDCLFLDKNNIVVRVVPCLLPFHLAFCAAACSVIELPAGSIAASATEKGNPISFLP